MFEYFDKDFFKFLLGFAAIIILSCLILLIIRVYQVGQSTDKAQVSPQYQTAQSRS